MIVVAGLRRPDRGELGRREAVFVGVVRILDDGRIVGIFEVVVAAADIENAVRARQNILRHVREEVAFTAEIGLLGRIVGDIAEILRTVMVADVILMRGFASGVGWLVVVAVLVPPPLHWRGAPGAPEKKALSSSGGV